MTTEVAVPGEITDAGPADYEARHWPEGPDRQYHGYVIIEWPAPTHPGEARAIPGWKCAILNATTGEPITTVQKITVLRVIADTQSYIIADLVMMADPDGMPVLNGSTVYPDGEGGFLTGVFPFLVAEMRVRP